MIGTANISKYLTRCVILGFSFTIGQTQAQEHSYNDTAPKPQAPIKLFGKVDIIGSSCAAAGITLSSNTMPATVDKLRLGSPAFYANIRKSDRVLSAKIDDNKLNLILERDGKRFTARLHTVATSIKDSLPALTANLDESSGRSTRKILHPEVYSNWLNKTYPTFKAYASTLDKLTVLDIEGQYDETGETLEAFGIPYTRLSPHQVMETSFEKVRAIIINCPGELSPEAIKKINEFVCNGGYLLTTDWTLDKFLAIAFPNHADWDLNTNKRPIYDARTCRTDPILFKNAPNSATWHMDGGCHMLKVLDPSKVTVLTSSEQLKAEDPKSNGVLSVTFSVERGHVLHLVGHFEGGGGQGAIPDAAPSIGISLRQAIAGNFIMKALAQK